MSYSTQDLSTEAMRLLGLLDANEEPDSEDQAYIVRIYTNLYTEWKIRDITYWPLAEIPEEAFDHIARIVADKIAPAFGDAAPTEFDFEANRQVSMGAKGWQGLKRLQQRPQTGARTTACYF